MILPEKHRNMLNLYLPQKSELWFRRMLLADPETMSYNAAWGGALDFPEENWDDWYDHWIARNEGKRYYRYLRTEGGDFVGEAAYHLDESRGLYLANVIVYAPFRRRGHGREALELLCRAAKERGVSVLHDDMASGNPARALFESAGFTEEYRTDEFVMLKKVL